MRISIILPAKNEANGLRQTLPGLRAAYPEAEVIVVDDGSTDETAAVAAEHGVRVLSSPYSMGNGAAIKRGARAASGEILVFMDADGQHDAGDIAKLLERLDAGGLCCLVRCSLTGLRARSLRSSAPPCISAA